MTRAHHNQPVLSDCEVGHQVPCWACGRTQESMYSLFWPCGLAEEEGREASWRWNTQTALGSLRISFLEVYLSFVV